MTGVQTCALPIYSPEIFLRAAEMLGVGAKDCIVFEDTPEAVRTAKRAGFTVAEMKREEEEISGIADFVIEDFGGVLGELEREACLRCL